MTDKYDTDWFGQQEMERDFLRNQLLVTEYDYSKSVINLVRLARSDSDTAVAAAQILLNCNSGAGWQLDVTDLGMLDYRYLNDALVVLKGRLLLHKRPRDVIEDGAEIFSDLQDKWQRIHVTNRYSCFYE